MNIYLKIFTAFTIIALFSALSLLKRKSFLEARQRIKEEEVSLIGLNIQMDNQKLLGLKGKELYEVMISDHLRIQELTDQPEAVFTLRYFTYRGNRCLLLLAFKDREVINNYQSFLCQGF